MQIGTVVTPLARGMTHAGPFVMHEGRVVTHAAGGDLQIGLEDSRVAMVVMHEGTAVSWGRAEVGPISRVLIDAGTVAIHTPGSVPPSPSSKSCSSAAFV